jgi:hypothetical protein
MGGARCHRLDGVEVVEKQHAIAATKYIYV